MLSIYSTIHYSMIRSIPAGEAVKCLYIIKIEAELNQDPESRNPFKYNSTDRMSTRDVLRLGLYVLDGKKILSAQTVNKLKIDPLVQLGCIEKAETIVQKPLFSDPKKSGSRHINVYKLTEKGQDFLDNSMIPTTYRHKLTGTKIWDISIDKLKERPWKGQRKKPDKMKKKIDAIILGNRLFVMLMKETSKKDIK